MTTTRELLGATALLAAASLTAQTPLPQLRCDEAPTIYPIGSVLTLDLDGRPGDAYAILADLGSGPIRVAGKTLRLDLGPALTTFANGLVPGAGRESFRLNIPNVPASLDLVPIYFQAVTIDSSRPASGIDVSNGESTILHVTTRVLAERFDAPFRDGFTGTFDPLSRHALRGIVTRRTVRTVDTDFYVFPQPVIGPLSPGGARVQNVLRAEDLDATGEPELITAIRWRAFGNVLQAMQLNRLDLELAHTDVRPDFTIDQFTSLPRFPNSGLDPSFAQNLANSRDRSVVRSGSYAVTPADLRGDGYVDYQLARPYPYNGVDSLLLDFRTGAQGVPGPGSNGQVLQLGVISSANPFARVSEVGGIPSHPLPVNPDAVTTGQGDSGVVDYQLEMLRIESSALSPFRPARVASPNYGAPVAATVLPGNSQVRFEFRGADDASGANATAFSTNIDDADGKQWLQIRVVLIADPVTLEVPEVDTLVIPLQ